MTRATFILITLLLAFPCPSPGQETHPDGTINQTVNGLRQGRWEIKCANDCIEAGEFKNGRKNGVWLTRTAGGTMISEITYTSGMAKGPAKIYYPNGSLMESGVWNVDHWEGAYTRYHENGNRACDFTYNAKGHRQGKQVYYHENGKVMYDGEWSDGKITGTISVYDETGKKIGERNYDAQGKFSGNTKIVAPDSSHGNAPKYNKRDKTGNLTIFDSSGRKEQSGQFENGKLINGERYVYDKAGKLIRTDKVRNGRVETSINR